MSMTRTQAMLRNYVSGTPSPTKESVKVANGQRPAKRRRFATREELVELIAPYLSALDETHPDGDYKWTDVAATALDALGEMQVPVNALVEIVAEEVV